MKKLLMAAAVAVLGATSALAADIPARPYIKAPPMPQVYDWTGFYVGANVGGAWTPSNGSSDFGPLFPPFAVLPPLAPVFTVFLGQLASLGAGAQRDGFIGGGQIGYNWQTNQYVLGVEADVVGTDLKGSSASASRTFGPPLIPVSVTQTVTVDFGRIDWMASFRARAGFAANRALFYVTGGAAVAEIGGSTTTVTNGPNIGLPAGTFTASNGGSGTRWGWTIGGGIEWAINNSWSVAGEYRHTDLGSRSGSFTIPDGLGNTFATGTGSSRLTVDQATARVNYRFGGPVFPKY